MDICRKVFYEGYVQGVGFRYRAVQIVRDFDITGYVRNLSDGRVELLVEGDEAEVRGFLERLRESMEQHILKVVENEQPCAHSFTNFGIRY